MQKQWQYFLLALGFFTRIPVPSSINFQESDLNHSVKYFPLIGVIVGFFGAVFFYAAGLIFPQAIAVLISMAGTIYLTGAFHEDGLADSADGIGGGWEREQILTIMQDSRLGTYGAIALFLMLLAKFQTLNSLNPIFIPFALITGHTLSRLWAVLLMATLIYVKPAGKAKPLATKLTKADLIVAIFFGLLPFLCIASLLIVSKHSQLITAKFVLMSILPGLIVWLWWRAKLIKNLGGYTGDTLGATQQLTELAFYLGVCAWSIDI
ncbi:MAG: adenosylcobinamide-GDP ribazoletransferase [Pseudomonadota bacterium]